jgi:Flp pilus assembly protein TadG
VTGRGGRRREQGSAAIELLGLLPLFVLVVLLALQVFATVYTAQAAGQAARDGARQFSRTGSLSAADAAVRASLPSSVTLVRTSPVGPGHGVRVEVLTPFIVRVVDRTLTRTVVMP